MISQIATRVTLSLAFLSAAMMFSPYPLVDQGKGNPGLIKGAERLVDSSKQFAADVSRDQVKMEQSELKSRMQKVGRFRDRMETAAADKIQDLRRTLKSTAGGVEKGAHAAFENVKETVAPAASNVEQAASAGMHTAKEAAESAIHKSSEAAEVTGHKASEAAGSSVHKASEAAESMVHKASDAVESAAEKASEAAGSATHKASEAAGSVVHKASEAAESAGHKASEATDSVSDILITSAPQELKQGSVNELHSLADAVGAVVESVKEDVKEAVQKTKQVGQGLKEKLESVTAHIRESTAWPEPEAISILAEGVWAPKEQKLLPALDSLLGKGAQESGSAAAQTESTIDEKLGIQGSGAVDKLKSYIVKSAIWQRLSSLGKQASAYLPKSDFLSSKVAAIPAAAMKLVHYAAVVIQLGVLLWSLWLERFWLMGEKKSGTASSGSQKLAKVELASSALTLTTFLAVFPWASSGIVERNEVQVLAGTLAEALRRLFWDSSSSKGKAVEVPAGIETSHPSQGEAPSPKKRNKKHKAKSYTAPEGDRMEKPASLAERVNLSASFNLLAQLSAVGALCYHVYFLGKKAASR